MLKKIPKALAIMIASACTLFTIYFLYVQFTNIIFQNGVKQGTFEVFKTTFEKGFYTINVTDDKNQTQSFTIVPKIEEKKK